MKLELFAPTERYRGRGPHPVILQTEQIGHLDSEKRGDPQVMVVFNTTLWQTYKKLWKITIFNGKINYKWPFSIVMLVYQRIISAVFSSQEASCRDPRTPHCRAQRSARSPGDMKFKDPWRKNGGTGPKMWINHG